MLKRTNNEIFFSIITCTLNCENYLKRNIDSVRWQSFANYEQIFIDGYSRDATQKIIRHEVIKNKERLRLIMQRPQGISGAFNQGIKKSKGRYLIFLNSDDWFYDSRVLKSVYDFLKKNSFPDWIYGKIAVIDQKGKKIGTFPERKIFQVSNPLVLKFLNYIPHQAVFMNRNVFKKFGKFDERLESSMDYDLYLRMINKTKCIFFNKVISNFFVHKDSKTSSVDNKVGSRVFMEKVQSRYLPALILLFARFFNLLVERYNKIYKIQ